MQHPLIGAVDVTCRHYTVCAHDPRFGFAVVGRSGATGTVASAVAVRSAGRRHRPRLAATARPAAADRRRRPARRSAASARQPVLGSPLQWVGSLSYSGM